MFEKLKEYTVYIILSIITMFVLYYAIFSSKNTEIGTEFEGEILNSISHEDRNDSEIKQQQTIFNFLQPVLYKFNEKFGDYELDNTTMTYLNGEDSLFLFNGKKITGMGEMLESGISGSHKLRLMLLSTYQNDIEGRRISNLTQDKIIYEGGEITSNDFHNLTFQERGFKNYGGYCLGTFKSKKEGNTFRDEYFPSGLVNKIDNGNYIVCFLIGLNKKVEIDEEETFVDGSSQG